MPFKILFLVKHVNVVFSHENFFLEITALSFKNLPSNTKCDQYLRVFGFFWQGEGLNLIKTNGVCRQGFECLHTRKETYIFVVWVLFWQAQFFWEIERKLLHIFYFVGQYVMKNCQDNCKRYFFRDIHVSENVSSSSW